MTTTLQSHRETVPAATPPRPSVWPWVGLILTLILVPAMLLAPAWPPVRGVKAANKQNWVLGFGVLISVLSAVAYFIPTPLFPRRRMTFPLLILGGSLLLISNIMWNRSFLDYTRTHDYMREVFRRPMRNFHAPLYGRYHNAIEVSLQETKPPYYLALPAVILSGLVALAWFAWARRRPLERRWDWRSFAMLLSFQLALIFLFALCEPPHKPGWAPARLTVQLSGYSEFAQDIDDFHGVRDTLRRYVQVMPDLNWYGRHYPPGNLILMMIERQVGIPGMTKSIVCLLTVLSAIPLYLLARELGFDDVATSAALLLFTATTGVLIFCTINTTSLLLLPSTVCLWTLVRSLKTGSLIHAAVLGLVYAAYLFFSFSASILGVLMALTTLLGWWAGVFSMRNILRTGMISLACVFASIFVLYLITDFNLIACFVSAVRGHQTQQGNEGFDDFSRWLIRSSGNIIAYLVSTVPLSILAAVAVRSTVEPARRALFIAALLTVLIAGFSGLFYVETERIWIFMTPAFALAAAHELKRRADLEGNDLIHAVFFLVLTISCTQEFFFQHYR